MQYVSGFKHGLTALPEEFELGLNYDAPRNSNKLSTKKRRLYATESPGIVC